MPLDIRVFEFRLPNNQLVPTRGNAGQHIQLAPVPFPAQQHRAAMSIGIRDKEEISDPVLSEKIEPPLNGSEAAF